MLDIGRLFQAFVAPAIFVSAAALLLLSLNVRLMGIVSRLRDFQHRRHHATESGHAQEAEGFALQVRSIEARAELIRKAMLLTLVSLVGTIFSCLLLGLALYWELARLLAVAIFVCCHRVHAGRDFLLHRRDSRRPEFCPGGSQVLPPDGHWRAARTATRLAGPQRAVSAARPAVPPPFAPVSAGD